MALEITDRPQRTTLQRRAGHAEMYAWIPSISAMAGAREKLLEDWLRDQCFFYSRKKLVGLNVAISPIFGAILLTRYLVSKYVAGRSY